jgi:hypothetical protein
MAARPKPRRPPNGAKRSNPKRKLRPKCPPKRRQGMTKAVEVGTEAGRMIEHKGP